MKRAGPNLDENQSPRVIALGVSRKESFLIWTIVEMVGIRSFVDSHVADNQNFDEIQTHRGVSVI